LAVSVAGRVENAENRLEASDTEEPDLGIGYRDLNEPVEPDLVVTEPEFVEEARNSASDLSFIASLPVKLPAISSEDLEHFEDKALDEAYERKLELTGDDLLPISSALEIAALAIGTRQRMDPISANSGGTAAAPARSPLSISIPDFVTEDESVELPKLSENPTNEELLAYAKAHPTVRKALRIFRAKIVSVEKK